MYGINNTGILEAPQECRGHQTQCKRLHKSAVIRKGSDSNFLPVCSWILPPDVIAADSESAMMLVSE